MSSNTPRSARNASVLQVGTLRYDRSSTPANGGVAVVNAQGNVQVQNSLLNLNTVSADSGYFPQANISRLTGIQATITNITTTDMTVLNRTHLNSLDVSSNAIVDGIIQGDSLIINRNINTDTLTTSGPANFNNNVTVAGNFYAEAVDISGLNVRHNSVFNGGVTFNQGIAVTGDVTVYGNINDVTINQTEYLTVDNIYTSYLFPGRRNTSYTSNYILDVSGNASITGGATVANGLTVTSGGATVANGLTVTSGGAMINGTLKTTDKLSVQSNGIDISGGIRINTGGITVRQGGATITGTSTVNGTLKTTDKFSVQTNGIDVSGGIRIFKGGLTIYEGGITVKDNTTIDGTLTLTDNFTVQKNGIDVSGGIRINTGGITVRQGGATVTGASTIDGTLTLKDNLTVQKNGIDVSGGIRVNTGNIRIKENLIINGSLFDISGGLTKTDRINIKNSGGTTALNPPSIYWDETDGNNTGINHPENNTLTLITNGGERVRVTDVGAAVTGQLNTTGKLTVQGGGAAITGNISVSGSQVDVSGAAVKLNSLYIKNNGTTTAPAISWINSSNNTGTGINHPANNTISLVAGGSTRVLVTDYVSESNTTSHISLRSIPKATPTPLLTTLDIFPGRKGHIYDISGWTTFDPNYYASIDTSNPKNDYQGGIYMYGDLAVAQGIIASGTISGGSITTSGAVTATGTVSGSSISTTGAVSAGTVTATGAVSGSSISTTGTVSAGAVTATGAVTGSSISTTGAVNAVSVGASTIGAQNITATGAVTVTGSGGSTVTIASGNITTTNLTVNGTLSYALSVQIIDSL